MRARLLRRAVLVVAVVAVAAVATGSVLAVRGWLAGRTSPSAVVRAYFAALQRGDADAALDYGTTPSGSRALVTDGVLRAQQQAAPIRSLSVLSTRTTGTRAVVEIGYVLDFPDGPSTIAATVDLHHSGGGWLLDATAIPTHLAFDAARHRASVGGARVPTGRVLVFPGALPVHFDSSYLTGTIGNGSIGFGASASTGVQVTLTASGRRAVRAGLLAALTRCLARGGSICPQPSERYLPGSVRGRADGPLQHVRIALTPSANGVVSVRASATATVRYQRLDFTDRLRSGRGDVRLDLRAEAIVRAPLAIRWTG